MRRFSFIIGAVLVFAVLWDGGTRPSVQAQAVPLTIVAALPHTACRPIEPATTQFCFATDGLWQSLNGAAYVQLGAAAPGGVASFKGRTGDVVPVAGDYTCAQITGCPTTAVQTVNGKPGPAVVLSVSSTVQ